MPRVKGTKEKEREKGWLDMVSVIIVVNGDIPRVNVQTLESYTGESPGSGIQRW